MRTCSKTGKAIAQGWVFFGGEQYASTQEIADQIAQEYGFMNFKELYDETGGDDGSESYFTDFEDEQDSDMPDHTSEVDAIESDVKLSIQEGFEEGYVDSGLNEAIVKLYRLGIDVKELKASEGNQMQAHYILSAISQWRANQC